MYGDSRIIALLQKRDEQALQLIRAQYGKLCFQIAYRITGSREDAEECVSDLLMHVWNAVPPACPENLQAYLTSLVRRNAINKYKQAHREKRGGRQFTAALDELAEIVPDSSDVETEFDRRTLTAVMHTVLDTLPAQTRRVFLQRYLFSMPLADIAKDNGMTLSAVKVSLHRTRKAIKEFLKKEGYCE